MRMTGSQLIVSAMLLLAGAALGCASASTADTVRGTAMYRERIALPPGAVLEVSLQDVSLADAPARELGSVRIEDPEVGQVVLANIGAMALFIKEQQASSSQNESQ